MDKTLNRNDYFCEKYPKNTFSILAKSRLTSYVQFVIIIT